MGKITFLGLLLLALLLFVAAKRRWVGREALQTLANVSGVVALVAAALVFVIPSPVQENSDIEIDANRTQIIAFDDFSDPESGWVNDDPGGWWFRGYQDDRYVIRFDGGGDGPAFAAWLAIGKFSDVGLQAIVLGPFSDGDKARRGIAFGSSDGQRDGVYAFTTQSDGTCEIVRYLDGEFAYLKSILVGKVSGFDREASHHVLKIEIKYREATGYVDNRQCVQGIIADYSSGYVGLLATASTGSSDYIIGEAYFDDFLVYTLP